MQSIEENKSKPESCWAETAGNIFATYLCRKLTEYAVSWLSQR